MMAVGANTIISVMLERVNLQKRNYNCFPQVIFSYNYIGSRWNYNTVCHLVFPGTIQPFNFETSHFADIKKMSIYYMQLKKECLKEITMQTWAI